MKKDRIGIVVQQFPYHSETFIVTKILGMIDSGFDVHVFATGESKFKDRFKVLENREDVWSAISLSVFQYKNKKVKFALAIVTQVLWKFLCHPVQWMQWLKICRRNHRLYQMSFVSRFLHGLMFLGHKVDILHIEFDFQAYGLMDIKDVLKCKCVLSGRGAINRTSVPGRYPKFYDYIFSRVDAYHFISKYLHREAVERGLRNDTPVYFIEPAIDLSRFTRRSKQSTSRPELITAARLDWAKGYEFTLDAVALVKQRYPNLIYRIIGEGNYSEALRFTTYQLGLVDHVIFEGPVKREDVATYLERADIMIHGALEEGFCNAVIEGQAMELPIVCSDAGGLPENVENGVTGFVVPRRDARAMAEKIIYLIENDQVRKEMGAAGRKRVLSRYNIDDQTKKFNSMYRKIVDDYEG